MAEDSILAPVEEEQPADEFMTFKEFLEDYPVGTTQKVSGYYRRDDKTNVAAYLYPRATPTLSLYCAECGGIRHFNGIWTHYTYINGNTEPEDFLVYTCQNCKITQKHFCLISHAIGDGEGNGQIIKIGEFPELHIKLPSNLRKLIGDDFDYFIKGLKCERNGLGVGAYTYYRRVLENQKDRLLGEILKVSKKLSAKKEIIQTIEAAIKETQFTKAINMVKDSLPESLLIDGHNPFKLLHIALSIGIHNETDEECLKIAHNIRIVLIDLAERIKLAMSEQKGIKNAVASLLKFNDKS